jgi:hypothetical protein
MNNNLPAFLNRYLFEHLSVFIVLTLMFLVYGQLLQNQVKAKEITAQGTILAKYFYDAGLAVGAYSLTRNQMFAERYSKLVDQIPGTLDVLHQLVVVYPSIIGKFAEISETTHSGLAELSQDKQVIDAGELNVLSDDQGQARKAYKRIKLIADRLQAQLDCLSAESEKLAGKAGQLQIILAILLPVVLFAYVMRNYFVENKLDQGR